MAVKKIRNYKVCRQSGYQYKSTPAILIRGQWLKELGFDIGDYVSVSCEDGRLVITPDAERAALEAAEAEYMAAETEKLQKKLREEREKIRLAYVAERSNAYGAGKEA